MACATTKRTRCIPADCRLQVVLHFLHTELTNHCNACLHFCFSRSETHDCHDPHIQSSISLRPEPCGARIHNQSHSNIISNQWRSKCFPHRYPEPACNCHFKTKTPSSPMSGVTSGRQSIKYTFFYSALEDLNLGGRDAERHQGRDVCKIGRKKHKIKAFCMASIGGQACIYTHRHLYISAYIAGYLLCSYNLHLVIRRPGRCWFHSLPHPRIQSSIIRHPSIPPPAPNPTAETGCRPSQAADMLPPASEPARA